MSEQTLDPALKEMVKAGVHIGHRKSRRHPKMMPFVYGIRGNTEIIDVEQTMQALERAKEFLYEKAKNRALILFVGTRPSVAPIVRETAEKLDAPYVITRWIGGTITNWAVISKRLAAFRDLIQAEASGELAQKYTKAERVRFQRQLARLEEELGGIRELKKVPDVLVLSSLRSDSLAAREAKKKGIPVVALVDTDTDPALANYLIPGNDDALPSVQYLLAQLAEAIAKGQAEGAAARASEEAAAVAAAEEKKRQEKRVEKKREV